MAHYGKLLRQETQTASRLPKTALRNEVGEWQRERNPTSEFRCSSKLLSSEVPKFRYICSTEVSFDWTVDKNGGRVPGHRESCYMRCSFSHQSYLSLSAPRGLEKNNPSRASKRHKSSVATSRVCKVAYRSNPKSLIYGKASVKRNFDFPKRGWKAASC